VMDDMSERGRREWVGDRVGGIGGGGRPFFPGARSLSLPLASTRSPLCGG
jgi:hypothetical protein